MKKKKFLTRRKFLAIGAVTAAGVWSGFSQQLGARMIRGAIAQASRGIAKPRFVPTPELWNDNAITAAWLGHSSVLINFYGVNIITDPVLHSHVGAETLFGTIGAKRLVSPALTTSQLPQIDLALISHAHMDHMDLPTLKSLPATVHAVTAHATRDLLAGTDLKQATELKWGEKTCVKTRNGDLEVQAFEVNHWGARWKLDKYRGYNGYIVSREGKKIIFGGDTAMCDSFRSLRSEGPFELAIMPIGAYNPWIACHCAPEQAVQMANAAGANYLLPIHFKTFVFGREGTVEPMQRLEACLEKQRIGWREIGQTFCLS